MRPTLSLHYFVRPTRWRHSSCRRLVEQHSGRAPRRSPCTAGSQRAAPGARSPPRPRREQAPLGGALGPEPCLALHQVWPRPPGLAMASRRRSGRRRREAWRSGDRPNHPAGRRARGAKRRHSGRACLVARRSQMPPRRLRHLRRRRIPPPPSRSQARPQGRPRVRSTQICGRWSQAPRSTDSVGAAAAEGLRSRCPPPRPPISFPSAAAVVELRPRFRSPAAGRPPSSGGRALAQLQQSRP
mmetsp:Transcript_84454/g.242481  ORF Transcript_84454/g.242481 Transcript_84454/m.242481 type:complete len:242 (+) Transcript_84454:71-796(+)